MKMEIIERTLQPQFEQLQNRTSQLDSQSEKVLKIDDWNYYNINATCSRPLQIRKYNILVVIELFT